MWMNTAPLLIQTGARGWVEIGDRWPWQRVCMMWSMVRDRVSVGGATLVSRGIGNPEAWAALGVGRPAHT